MLSRQSIWQTPRNKKQEKAEETRATEQRKLWKQRRKKEEDMNSKESALLKIGDEINQCLQIIITNAGNIKERGLLAGFQIDRAALTIEDAVQRAAIAVRALGNVK
jgi:hypothetical protein